MKRNNILKKILVLVLAMSMVMGLGVTSFAHHNSTVTVTVRIEFQDDGDANTFIPDGPGYEITVAEGSSLYDLIEAEKDETTGMLPFDPHWDEDPITGNVITPVYLNSYYYMDAVRDSWGIYPNNDYYSYDYGWNYFTADNSGQLTRPVNINGTWKAMDEYIIQDGDEIVLRYGYSYTRFNSSGDVLDFQWLLPGQVAN